MIHTYKINQHFCPRKIKHKLYFTKIFSAVNGKQTFEGTLLTMSVSFDTELLSDGDSFFINKCWRQFGGFLFACDKTVEWEWANKIVRWENVCLTNTCVRPDFVIVPRFEQDNEFHHFRPLQIRRLSCYPECLDVCVFTTVHKNLINIWHVGLHNKETKPRFFPHYRTQICAQTIMELKGCAQSMSLVHQIICNKNFTTDW